MRIFGLILAASLGFPMVAAAQCPTSSAACPPLSTGQLNLGGAIVNPQGVPFVPPVAAPVAGQALLSTGTNGGTVWTNTSTGTVTQTTVAPANGFAGSVANGTTTPAITLSTTVTGMAKGNGTSLLPAIAGTDYLAPNSSGAGLSGLSWPQIGSTPTTLGGYGVPTTGTGSAVLATSPTLVTPALGTPASGVLTNATGLPLSTGISGLGTGVATGLANAATGSGAPVLGTAPTIANATLTGTTTAATLSASVSFNGWAPRFAVRMDSNPTPAAAGTGNITGDALTLNAGCTTNPIITVNASGGAVTSYNVTNPGSCVLLPTNPVGVLSTTGTGTGATFNLSWDPWSAATAFSNSVAGGNNGNFILGATPGSYSGTESTFIGGLSPTIVSGNFITDIGIGNCGIGSGTTLNNASFLWCVGSNAGRNVANGASLSMFAGTFGSSGSPNITGSANFIFAINSNPALSTGNDNAFFANGGGAIATGSGNFVGGVGAGGNTAGTSGSIIIGGNPNTGQASALCASNSVCIGGNNVGNANINGGNYILIGNNAGKTTCGAGGQQVVLIGIAVDCMNANTSLWFNADNAFLASVSAPTVSGFGTSPSLAHGTSSAAFQVNVGTGGTASSGTVTFATNAPNGWACIAVDGTNPATSNTVATPNNAGSITLTNYSRTTGAAIAWAASDIITVHCNGF